MARLRFPGRPGQRIGKNYVKCTLDDLKLSAETCNSAQHKIEMGLKIFHDLFGYSDEEEEFEGFTQEDIADSESLLALKVKQNERLQQILDSNNPSPSTSEVEKLLSSDSESSSSSLRRSRGMRDISRKSYDKMLKDGLGKVTNKSYLPNNNLYTSSKSRQITKPIVHSRTTTPKSESFRENIIKLNPFKSKSDDQVSTQSQSESKLSDKNSAFNPHLENIQHQGKTRRRRKRSMRPNVKKKFPGRFMYSNSKYSSLRKRLPTIKENETLKNKLRNIVSKDRPAMHLGLDSIGYIATAPDSSDSVSIVKEPIKPLTRRPYVRRKRFVLPTISARSSRKIIPRKRYIDEYDFSKTKVHEEDSQCSRSSTSGSSETISAMDGGSSPDNSQLEDVRQSRKFQKKVGLLDKPLLVEGKRAWKPSLKVQMKLSQMNCEYPFELKRNNIDDSSGTCTSSGSFKDIIKPDMVSKYAEKMAQKPKERPFKILESFKRSVPQSIKSDIEKVEVNSSENSDDGKDKVAAKIEKLLKSQWEGRLKDPAAKLPTKVESPVEKWMSSQQERTSTQRRTKTIIRKARLQLKKKNLNLRARKTDKELANNASEGTSIQTDPLLPEKKDPSLSGLPLDAISKSSTSTTPIITNPESPARCIVCGFSKVVVQPEKLYDQMSCQACTKFFSSFAESPKQYFCSKDGDCSIDGSSDTVSRKVINSRCKACWLKTCMERLTVSGVLREQLLKYVPRLDAPPHNALLFVENTDETVDGITTSGPRIKHVCRRAAVALGLPRATFSDASVTKESFNLSALPQEEKQKILETTPLEENVTEAAEPATPVCDIHLLKPSTSASKAVKPPAKKKSRKEVKVKNRVHLDLLKKSSLLIQKEQKRRKLLMKKSMKHFRKQSFKKSLKVGKKNEMKKTLKFSYKSAVKTSLQTSPKLVSKMPLRSGRFRKARCKQCEGCQAEDCGECAYCLDKKKFGGPNLIKQACMHRRCLRPVMPASKKKLKSSLQKSKTKSFEGDALSLSSSPTSPDSSCGSSCSSTTSSSSSGSSTSSSSSHSSSTSSSSSSDVLSVVQRTTVLGDGCGGVPFVQSAAADPVILQESECMDNNVVTNTHFQEQDLDETLSCSSFKDMASSALPPSKIFYGEPLSYDNVCRGEGDTILFEDSSSLIELKNASFGPSLLYGGAGEQEDSVSCSSNSGSKGQGSGKNNASRNPYSREQDQYGSAGSGSQESNGDEDEDENEDDQQKKKHYIYADYWDEYEFERISSQGFALVSSQQIPLPCACFLCGSAGEEKLIFCVLCCEPYHTFCLPENDVPREENLENWCCKRCQCCSVCGLKHNLLKCKTCQQSYHAECLTPLYPTKPSRKKKVWVCPKCVKCKSCGTTSPVCGNGLLWNFDLLLCQPCAKLTDKGNYCPVCRKCYEENDYESEMVQCFKCNRWVHASCDNITAEGYEILSCLPDTVVYTCVQCSVEETPMWKKAIKEYLKHGLKSVLNSLLSSRCARHLIKQVNRPSESIEFSNNPSTTNSNQIEIDVAIVEPVIASAGQNQNSNKKSFLFAKDGTHISADVEATVLSLLNTLDSNSMLDSSNNETDLNCTENCNDPLNNIKKNLEIFSSKSEVIPDVTKDSQRPDLIAIKHNLEQGKYKTIALFFDDVVEAIELGNELGMKHHTSETKSVLIKETERIFPWFKVPAAKVWHSKIDLPEGMLPNAVIPPSVDHTYSQYLERIISYPSLKLKEDTPLLDTRTCVLCSYTGDSMPKKCGRLLYCGQDDWIHVNCAMWSAEVFEQQGSLRNVYPAIARGKLMNCEFCSQLGATVGCCVRGCPANYHFYCARKDEAVLQRDRKVFCALHKENVDDRIVNENDFPVEEKVYVNQTSISPKWVKKKWQYPIDVDTLHVVIGSLTIKKLGHLTTLSTHGKILIPVAFECSRLFWSTKNPHLRVKYTCKVIQMVPNVATKRPVKIANTTTIHTPNISETIPEMIQHDENPLVNTPAKCNGNLIDNNIVYPKELKCEVEKLLYRLIKKVVKVQRKNKLQFLKEGLLKNNNTLEMNKNSNLVLNDTSNDKSNNQIRFNGSTSDTELSKCSDCDNDLNSSGSLVDLDSGSMNCDNFEGEDKSDYLDYYASLFKVNSYLDTIQDQSLPSELSNPDSRRNSTKKYEFKKYRKRIKTPSFTGKPEIDSAKLLKLLAEKNIAKDKFESALKKFRGMKDMSPEFKDLLNSVIPSGPISETVLPIFNMGLKENNVGITESSGYSSNEDGHFRLPSSIPGPTNKTQCKTLENNELQSSSNLHQVDPDYSALKKIRFNGDNDLTPENDIENQSNHQNVNSPANNADSTFKNVDNHRTYSKGNSLNGVCQSMVPFKCCKCKRVYRNSESFTKHSESCNFFLDSSSDDEKSDSSNSSEVSFVSSSNSSVKIIEESNHDVPVNQNKKSNSFLLNKPRLNYLKDNETSDVNISSSQDRQCFIEQMSAKHHQLSESFSNQNSDFSYEAVSNNQSMPSLINREHQKSSRAQELRFTPTKTMIQPSPPLVSPPIECSPVIHQPPMQNVTLNANNLSVITENAPSTFNCGYGAAGGVVPLPCNTLIIPPTPSTVQHSNTVLGQIPVPQGNFLSSPIEINAGSQLSYVGSITITNNETMSLAVNVPDQIVPIYPQQDLNFGVIPSPMQMQPTEIHLQQVNVQHISVQSSFSTSTLNQVMFPQQAMSFPQGQVMFMDNSVQQQAQMPQNYVFQVPVEQPQNCAYTTFIPQQGMQPQFVNQFAFQPTSQPIQSQQVPNVICQQQNLMTQQIPDQQQLIGLTNQVNTGFINQPLNTTSQFQRQIQTPAPPVLQPMPRQRTVPSTILPKPSPVTLNNVTPTPPPPELSNQSSSASDISSCTSKSSKNRVSAITVPPNSDLVDILKRAAEKMLSMSAEKSKSLGEAPEKKTRFAHTRKVAARKLEKLKQRNAALHGTAVEQSSPSKPKRVQFNIAALKPTFSIPFLPRPASVPPSDSPSPMSDPVQQPSPLSERCCDSPMPLLNADVPLLNADVPLLNSDVPLLNTDVPLLNADLPLLENNNSDMFQYEEEEQEEDSPLLRLHMQKMEHQHKEKPTPDDKPYLLYEINSEDGFHVQSRNLRDAWMKVYDELQDARMAAHMKPITLAPEDVNGIRMMGLDNPALLYLLEQLPGAECCVEHDFLFHPPAKELFEIPENPTGCARSESFNLRREYDMFNFLASEHRNRPVFLPPEEDEEITQKSSRRNGVDLPIAMRFRDLKTAARETVGVYRSSIHGRGLFCKRNIDPGELVIEYAGEVIRSILTDKRERIYQSKGIGCYMFRIDDDEVVDATMHGNAARFINHSCEPNCFSKVVTVDGKKHIVIFALRRIMKGEELTYDYKFPLEEEKLPCHCNTRRCRKYLN
ncbi:hypothetical protein JTE90_026689 [Oedothorax gibbosus]|uniref:Histone-lysine N-methyltransferase trithorax n=1 Tax=Oedothorax gibbosus TaxID=931172 RepID=A0AAV6V2N5_9ARAC|nr:hypothetical protein JTE90_026689 [Oedothorax gibbosus]